MDDDSGTGGPTDSTTEAEGRAYHDRQIKLNEAWAKVREMLTQNMIQLASMPSVSCAFCCIQIANIYYRQCGGYFCNSCTDSLYSSINVFHKPLIWKVQVCAVHVCVCVCVHVCACVHVYWCCLCCCVDNDYIIVWIIAYTLYIFVGQCLC